MFIVNGKTGRFLQGCLMAAALCSCNNDIFVERLPEVESNIELAPGETHTVAMNLDKIESVHIFCSDDYEDYLQCFGYDGELLTDMTQFPASVAKMVLGSPRFTLEAYPGNDEIKFALLDNTYTHPLTVDVIFGYGYASREIELTLAPGAPLDIKLYYIHEKAVSYTGATPVTTRRFTNNGPRTQRITYKPYDEARTRVLLEGAWPWMTGIQTSCRIPEYSGGEWTMTGTDAQLQFDSYAYFIPEVADTEEIVEIPPYSTAVIRCTVSHAVFELPFLGEARQPNSGVSFPIEGKCIVSQPVKYQTDVEII